MKKLNIIMLIVLVLVLMGACSKPPVEEMEKARDAVFKAENDADANVYASNTLRLAREAMNKMQNEADAKNYDNARNFAGEAVSLSEKAIAEGKTNASRQKDEATNLISSLSEPLAETSNSLDAAWRSERIRLDFAALQVDMEQARRGYEDARQSLQAERYRDAITQGQAVRSLLADINTALSGGAQAASRKQ